MNQTPALKTRRSNAVHTRRLALHVSLLERDKAAREAETTRAVRLLLEELNHLHTPTRNPKISPRNSQIVGTLKRDVVEEGQTKFPRLALSERVSDSKNHAGTSASPKQSSALCEGLPAVPTLSDSLTSNGENSAAYSRQSNTKRSDSSLMSDTSLRHSPANLARTIPGKTGGLYPQRSGGSINSVHYTVGVPFKANVVHRASRSLSLTARSRDHDLTTRGSQGQHQQQSHDDAEKSGISKGNIPAPQRTETNTSPKTLEKFNDPKSMKPLAMETDQQVSASLRKSGPTSSYPILDKPQASPVHSKISALTSTVKSADVVHSRDKQCHLAESPGHRCRHFPCRTPLTYHSLGFHPDHSTHPWRDWLRQNARRPHHRLAPDRPPSLDSLDGRRTPADAPSYMRHRRLGKEEVIRLDMARKKHVHSLARPRSRSTKYGRPMPFRQLMYPARCSNPSL